MKNSFRIVDMHAHIYPDKIAEKAAKGTDAFYGTVAKANGTVSSLLSETETDFFVVHSVATTAHQVSSANRFLSKTVAENSDKMMAFATFYPGSDCVESDLNEVLQLGFRGVKIHPDIQRFPIDHPGYLRLYDFCAEHELFVLMHTGDLRYDFSNCNRLIPLLKNYPKTKFIGAHFGAYSNWKEGVKLLPEFDNLWVDCSSSLMFLSEEDAVRQIRAFGADRVLYGSDYPMWSPKEELQRFFSLPLSDSDRRRILSENAERLFHLE